MDNCLPVGNNGPAKRQKKTSCMYYQQEQSKSVHSLGLAWFFLSRQHDVIASFSLACGGCRQIFCRENILEVFLQVYNKKLFYFIFYLPLFNELCYNLDRREAHVAISWLCLMAT